MIREARPGRQWGDPSPRDDPEPRPDRPHGRPPVYGRVYELFTGDPRDGEHPYVGRTTTTIAKRVRRHKSADDITRDPWKARIIDGPRGYRLLETVYSCGIAAEDARSLARAEAFWIDRLRPTHNDVRPVRPRLGDPLPPRPRESVARRRGAPRTRRRFPWRAGLFLALSAVTALLAGRLVAALALPWPWAPYVAALVLGAPLGWRMTMAVLRGGRRLRVWR